MILIWGFRIRSKTLSRHPFFCPGCGGDRVGLLKAARRWFTLFWIPLIPLKEVGQFVECETCNRKFQPAVLQRPTTDALGTVLANATHALVVMIAAVGDTTDPRLRAKAVETIASVVPGYDDARLSTDLPQVDPSLADQYVSPLTEGLEVAGAERFLGDLVRVALAGGSITPTQRGIIDAAGRGLGLSPAHVTGVVATVTSSVEPPADRA